MATTPDHAAKSLKELMDELTPRELCRALRRTLKKEAGKVRSRARAELRKVKTKPRRVGRKHLPARRVAKASELAKTVVARVHRSMQGFTVAARPRGKAYMHTGRNGPKPVAFWLNKGTARGIRPSDYIERARRATAGSGERMVKEMRRQVERIINKRFKK